MWLEMKVKGLTLDPLSKLPILILRDEEDKRTLPIWVGLADCLPRRVVSYNHRGKVLYEKTYSHIAPKPDFPDGAFDYPIPAGAKVANEPAGE